MRFPVYYFRFKVVNNGKLQAEECEVFLEGLWIGRVHHPDHEPDSVYRDINNREKNQNKFFFELIEKPYAQWDCLVQGEYQISMLYNEIRNDN